MKELSPEMKIIFILRNPIERVWSHVRFDYGRKSVFRKVQLKDIESESELLRFIDSEAVHKRTDYLSCLRNIESVFPQENIFVGFLSLIHI